MPNTIPTEQRTQRIDFKHMRLFGHYTVDRAVTGQINGNEKAGHAVRWRQGGASVVGGGVGPIHNRDEHGAVAGGVAGHDGVGGHLPMETHTQMPIHTLQEGPRMRCRHPCTTETLSSSCGKNHPHRVPITFTSFVGFVGVRYFAHKKNPNNRNTNNNNNNNTCWRSVPGSRRSW